MTLIYLSTWILLTIGCYGQRSQTATSSVLATIARASLTVPSSEFFSTIVPNQSDEASSIAQPSVPATPSVPALPVIGEVTPPVICASSPVSNPTILPNDTIPAVAVTTGYSQADLDGLWSVVEANLPVSRPAITTVVEPIPTFTTGPEPPPFRPTFVLKTLLCQRGSSTVLRVLLNKSKVLSKMEVEVQRKYCFQTFDRPSLNLCTSDTGIMGATISLLGVIITVRILHAMNTVRIACYLF